MLQLYLALMTMLLLASCVEQESSVGPARPEADDAKLNVYVVNYPLQYFAEWIGTGLVKVTFPAPSEGDPAFWSPDAAVVAAYQGADLILLNGADYAKWVQRVTLPPSKIINTSRTFQDRYIVIEDALTHNHGPAGKHTHGETAFTTWLDMTLAIEQARAIRDALAKASPEGQSVFQEGFASLERDLLSLDERLRSLTSGKAEPLLGSHPIYQYLSRRYGLHLKSVHFEPDEVPDESAWHELKQLLEGHPSKWILWEGVPMEETETKLEELSIESIVFDPCGNKPKKGDFLGVMETNLSNLERIYGRSDSLQ